jgi:hypothetical protein
MNAEASSLARALGCDCSAFASSKCDKLSTQPTTLPLELVEHARGSKRAESGIGGATSPKKSGYQRGSGS